MPENSSLPKAVCDTCSIIRFRKAGILQELPKLFHLLIPEAVKVECEHSGHQSTDLSSFQCLPVKTVLNIGMHIGEREAISLALEQNAPILITDDDKAFKKATGFGLVALRSIQVIILIKETGLISSVKDALDKMCECGEGITSDQYEKALKEAGEIFS